MPDGHAIDSAAAAGSSGSAGATAALDEPSRRHDASGFAALIAAGRALSRPPTLLPPRAATSPATDIAALLTSLERLSPHAGDERADDAGDPRTALDRTNSPVSRPPSAIPTPGADTAPPRRSSRRPTGAFALSLALLAADADPSAASSGDAHPANGFAPPRRGGLAARFARGLRENLARPTADFADSADAPLGDRRGESRQQRQLESLLRIERLLDEAVRLLRQPHAAVFAADAPG